MTTIAAGTPVARAFGVDAHVVGATPHQPEHGFSSIDAAVQWRQAQLWFDRGFDTAQPRAASAVARSTWGVELLDLDQSMRGATAGSASAPAAAWEQLDDRILAIIDGNGARLGAPGGVADAAEGAMLTARAGAPALVAMDGANPALRFERHLPTTRQALVGVGLLALAGGGIAAATLGHRED